MNEAALALRGVSFSYNKAPFIQDLSASFEHGVVTSIIGPNGCGKSTLVKLMDGLVRPHAGDVLIDGAPVHAFSAKERARRVAVLAQAGRPPAMTVEALVACGRYPYQAQQGRLAPEDREQVERALELAGIAEYRHHDVRFLSGGQRQRAFIAMTLAQDTRIIMLDEPTTYLDVRACHETMLLVRRLHEEEGKTIIMVIHDLDLALRYSDALLVMQRGRVTCAGGVEKVLAAGAIEEAFGITIDTHATKSGRAYTLHPA